MLPTSGSGSSAERTRMRLILADLGGRAFARRREIDVDRLLDLVHHGLERDDAGLPHRRADPAGHMQSVTPAA